jgi:hypothetical protein
MLVTWFVAVYAVICAAAYFGNRRLMYFPDPKRISLAEAGLDGIQEIEIAAADGVILVACYVPAKGDRPTLLYFHGNAANAANRAPKMETIRRKNYRRGQCRRCNYGLRLSYPSRSVGREDLRLR